MEALMPSFSLEKIHSVALSASEFGRPIVIKSAGGTESGAVDLARLTHYQHASGSRIIKTNEFMLVSHSFSYGKAKGSQDYFKSLSFREEKDENEEVDMHRLRKQDSVVLGIAVAVKRKMLSRAKEQSFIAEVSRILRQCETRMLTNEIKIDATSLVFTIRDQCESIFEQQLANGNFEQNMFARDKLFDIALKREFSDEMTWGGASLGMTVLQTFPIQTQEPAEETTTPRPDPDELFDDILALNEHCFTYRICNRYYDAPAMCYGGLKTDGLLELAKICKLARFEVMAAGHIQKMQFEDEDIVTSIARLTSEKWKSFVGECLDGLYETSERIVVIGIAPMINTVCRTLGLFCSEFAERNITYAYPRSESDIENKERIFQDAAAQEIARECIHCKSAPLVGSITSINGKYSMLSDHLLFNLFSEGFCVADAILGEVFVLREKATVHNFREHLKRITPESNSSLEFECNDVATLLLRIEMEYLLRLAKGVIMH